MPEQVLDMHRSKSATAGSGVLSYLGTGSMRHSTGQPRRTPVSRTVPKDGYSDEDDARRRRCSEDDAMRASSAPAGLGFQEPMALSRQGFSGRSRTMVQVTVDPTLRQCRAPKLTQPRHARCNSKATRTLYSLTLSSRRPLRKRKLRNSNSLFGRRADKSWTYADSPALHDNSPIGMHDGTTRSSDPTPNWVNTRKTFSSVNTRTSLAAVTTYNWTANSNPLSVPPVVRVISISMNYVPCGARIKRQRTIDHTDLSQPVNSAEPAAFNSLAAQLKKRNEYHPLDVSGAAGCSSVTSAWSRTSFVGLATAYDSSVTSCKPATPHAY